MQRRLFSLLLFCLPPVACSVHAEEEAPWASNERTTFRPEIHHTNIADVALFASHPQVVTPVGIAVAPDGRVFVQENHTHKRESSYQGPPADRILVFEDTDDDGIADKRSVFYEGHTFSTDLLFGPDGHLYVSTRWFIARFRDAGKLQKAHGEPERLVTCETQGDYPHNGVGGLAIDPAHPQWLTFGFGENLGADYTFVGSDGTEVSGGGEGGSTYRCRTDGSHLTRRSTGHWNAFGMAFDLNGNLFSTDNDPNATPPNRLLHVVPGADFGYEYRYGRSGRHPLVSWYGENPGTLGMVGALGEAACGLVSYGPARLLSASWTDNRVDLHSLDPRGASFVASREPFLSGPDDFRPVHFDYSADGRYLYFTDWVKLSYPVHGHGRIWRVEFKERVQLQPLARAAQEDEMSLQTALTAVGSDDAYIRTHAIRVLTEHPDVLLDHDWRSDSNATARAHYAVALKRADAAGQSQVIPALLADEDDIVRYVGIKWIADEGLDRYRPELEQVLDRADLTERDLRATLASLAAINGTSEKEFSPNDKLLEMAVDAGRSAAVRALALRIIEADHPRLTVEFLASLLSDSSTAIQREAVRTLVIHPARSKAAVLARVAADGSLDAGLRADAIAGLASAAVDHQQLLQNLIDHPHSEIASEAMRAMVAAKLASRKLPAKPPVDHLPAWRALLDQATGEADVGVGRRIFFHATLGGCYKCHTMEGRGHAIGPDLTTIRNQSGITPERLLEHIANPNAEIAPYYRPQVLLTADGEIRTGLVIGKEGQLQAYVGSDGEIFLVDKDDIEERKELSTSIMPSGLLDPLTPDEIRDLIAYLLNGETD